MNTAQELLTQSLSEALAQYCSQIPIDCEQQINQPALQALTAIEQVLNQAEQSDFMIVEQIVAIMEQYGLDSGLCHDF